MPLAENWHRLLQFHETKLSPQIASLALSIFDKFPSVHQFTIFIDPHFVHDLRCKTRMPTERLSSAIRTHVLCSTEILRVPQCRFTFFTTISTRSLSMWPPSGCSCDITSTPTQTWITASWSAFVLGSWSHFKMVLRNPRSLMKPTSYEIECGVGPFRSQHVTPVWPYLLSTHQNWKRVCVFLCQETAVEIHNRSCSFFFLQ